MRLTGASSHAKHSSAIAAEISAPKPQDFESSYATITREFFFTDAKTVSRSHGLSVRRSITSTEIPLSATAFAATIARCTVAPYVTTVTSVPSRTTFALPNGIMKFGPGYGDLNAVADNGISVEV